MAFDVEELKQCSKLTKSFFFAFTWVANEVSVTQTVFKELFLLVEYFNFGLFGIMLLIVSLKLSSDLGFDV